MLPYRIKRRVLLVLAVLIIFAALSPLTWERSKTLLQALPVDMPEPPVLSITDTLASLDQIKTEPLLNDLGEVGEKKEVNNIIWSIAIGCFAANEAVVVRDLLLSHDYRSYRVPIGHYLQALNKEYVAYDVCMLEAEAAEAEPWVGLMIGPYLRQEKANNDLEEILKLTFNRPTRPEVVMGSMH